MNRHQFRDRCIEKEIGPDFRYAPRDDRERIADFVQNAGLSQIMTYDVKKIRLYRPSWNNVSKEGRDGPSRSRRENPCSAAPWRWNAAF